MKPIEDKRSSTRSTSDNTRPGAVYMSKSGDFLSSPGAQPLTNNFQCSTMPNLNQGFTTISASKEEFQAGPTFDFNSATRRRKETMIKRKPIIMFKKSVDDDLVIE
eukprot:Awhi_evm1s5897